MGMSERMSFAAFWPEYLGAHRDPRTRAFHYVGTSLGLCSLVAFALTMDWRFLPAAPILGYGFAMLAHPLFESNHPKTFERNSRVLLMFGVMLLHLGIVKYILVTADNQLLRGTVSLAPDALSALERQQQVAVWKARGRAARAHMKVKRGEA